MHISVLIVGIALSAFGLATLFSRKFDKKIQRTFDDSYPFPNDPMSHKARYFIRRYVSSVGFLIMGVMLAAIYFFSQPK
jgi:hypothetical protein